jgi:hypothetical protein
LPFHFARFVALNWATVEVVAEYEEGGLVSAHNPTTRGGLGRLELARQHAVPEHERWRMAPPAAGQEHPFQFVQRADLWGT